MKTISKETHYTVLLTFFGMIMVALILTLVPKQPEPAAAPEPEVQQEEKVEVAKTVEVVEIVEPVAAVVAVPVSTMVTDKGATVKFVSGNSADSSNRLAAVYISESDLKARIEQERTNK